MNEESNPLFEEIYIPIFEKDQIEITLSQGKGAIFFSTKKEALEFIEQTEQKDPKGCLKGCVGKVVKYKRDY